MVIDDAKKKLGSLRDEHSYLEAELIKIVKQDLVDYFQISNLDKRKRELKEYIGKLERKCFDDIIA